MYTDHQIPRELEHYLREARKMRSQYIGGLLRKGFDALSRTLRRTMRQARISAKGTFAQR